MAEDLQDVTDAALVLRSITGCVLSLVTLALPCAGFSVEHECYRTVDHEDLGDVF